MILMNTDRPVLWFDNEDKIIKVIDAAFLPYNMLGVIKDTDACRNIAEGVKNYDYLRSFFSERILLLSREHAKAILQSISNTQKLTEEERVKLALSCRALSITDNYWVKDDEETLSFADVNVRTNRLSDSLFHVSVLGTPVSLQHSALAIDIGTKGMFRKTWIRDNGQLLLFKSDGTSQNINTKAEICASDILNACGRVAHVQYKKNVKESVYGCVCKCFTDDRYSLVDADYVQMYCEHNGINFKQMVDSHYKTEMANMAVIDYVLLNPDRHINNWGFMVDNTTNKIAGIAPLYDFNQALIAALTHNEKEFDELIYEPTGLTMKESYEAYKQYATVDFAKIIEQPLNNDFQAIDKSVDIRRLIIRRATGMNTLEQKLAEAKNDIANDNVASSRRTAQVECRETC